MTRALFGDVGETISVAGAALASALFGHVGVSLSRGRCSIWLVVVLE